MGNKINPVAKGDAFEDMVFIKMKELLESEMLGLSSKYSEIFIHSSPYINIMQLSFFPIKSTSRM